MTNLTEVLELNEVAVIATELGFNTPMMHHTEAEKEMYLSTFHVETIDKDLPEGKAKLEVAYYEGKRIAAIAWMNGKKVVIPTTAIENFYNQITK